MLTVDSVALDHDQLMLIAEGHAAFQSLWAGVQLGVFDILSREPGLTLVQIAKQLELQYHPARILLTALTSLKILEKKENKYFNAEITEQMLVSNKTNNIIPILGWQHHIVYTGLIDFVDSLKQNRNVGLRHFQGKGYTLYERLESDKKIEKIFQDAMSSLSKQANQALVSSSDFSNINHIVDVGGGNGTNAIALAHKYPHLKVTVFDSSSICEMAKKNIAEAGLSDRIDTCPGNLFKDPFPKNVDAILFCHMFTIWSPEKNQKIIQKAYDSLNSGGKLIIFNMMGNADDTGSVCTALGSLYFMSIATGEGMLYSSRDYEDWLNQSRFIETYRIDGLPLDHNIVIGIK